MRPETVLVNISRGGLIDEEALVDALKYKRIAGAGLDVYVEEPVPFDHPLLGLPTTWYSRRMSVVGPVVLVRSSSTTCSKTWCSRDAASKPRTSDSRSLIA